jgi:hypothetical protein
MNEKELHTFVIEYTYEVNGEVEIEAENEEEARKKFDLEFSQYDPWEKKEQSSAPEINDIEMQD